MLTPDLPTASLLAGSRPVRPVRHPGQPAAFDKRNFEQHTHLIEPLPGLRGASFSKPRAFGSVAPYPLAELDFDDADALKVALKAPEMDALGADAEKPAGHADHVHRRGRRP